MLKDGPWGGMDRGVELDSAGLG